AAALAYALLAGLTLPTQRALIMLVIAAGAVLLRRGLLPGHALLLAFAGVLLFDPLAALATGFWMSFAAVAVLIWTFAWRPNQGSGFRAWLSGLLRSQLMIGLGLIALNAGVFNQVQWMGFPANLVAIPLVGFWILPSLLMSLVMIALDWPATAFLWLCEMGLEMLIDYLQWLQAISPATRVRPSISLAAMVLGVLGSLWLIGPPGWPARWLGLGLLVPVIWPALTPPLDSDELVLEMLDVGNGQAVLIQTRSELLLYDTGPGDGDGGDAIGRLLPAALADLERSRIDRLVVSSLHGGSRGGLASVIDQVPATQHFSAIGGQGVPCTSTIRWMSDAYHFSFLHPSPGLPDLGPNSSCVLMIEGPGGKILLTGRIDAGVERRLLVENSVLDVDVLVLADGGHRRAGSMSFIEALRPHLALASNERHDRWGRPHPELLDRLEAQDVALLSTGRCGALALRLQDGQPPSIVSALGRSSRFWHPEGDCP
ncbi:MAG: ComEC/Rec2 family competence protein, partial [Pseudomonadota bacterium]